MNKLPEKRTLYKFLFSNKKEWLRSVVHFGETNQAHHCHVIWQRSLHNRHWETAGVRTRDHNTDAVQSPSEPKKKSRRNVFWFVFYKSSFVEYCHLDLWNTAINRPSQQSGNGAQRMPYNQLPKTSEPNFFLRKINLSWFSLILLHR